MSLPEVRGLSGKKMLNSQMPSRAKERHREYYLALLRLDPENVSRLDAAYAQIRRAAFSSSDYLALQEAATDLLPYLYQKGLWHEQLLLAYSLLAIAMSSEDFDKAWIALDMIGSSLIRLSEWDRAKECYDHLVIIAERRGHAVALISSLKAKGYLHERREEWHQALECYQRCLSILPAESCATEATEIQAKINRIYLDSDSRDLAMSTFTDLLALYQQQGDERRCAETLREMGDLHLGNGQFEEAFDYYHRSAEASERCGHVVGLARAKCAVAEVTATLKCYDEALALYNDALKIYKQIGNRPETAYALLSLGDVYRQLNHYDQALACFRQAVAFFDEVGELPFVSLALNSIAKIYLEQGSFAEAEVLLQRAVVIDDALKLPSLELNRAMREQIQACMRAISPSDESVDLESC